MSQTQILLNRKIEIVGFNSKFFVWMEKNYLGFGIELQFQTLQFHKTNSKAVVFFSWNWVQDTKSIHVTSPSSNHNRV